MTKVYPVNPDDYTCVADLPDILSVGDEVCVWSFQSESIKRGKVKEVIPHAVLERVAGKLQDRSWIEYLVRWTNGSENLCRDSLLFVGH